MSTPVHKCQAVLIMSLMNLLILFSINNVWVIDAIPRTSIPLLSYNDTNYGISIKYPSNWQIDSNYTSKERLVPIAEFGPPPAEHHDVFATILMRNISTYSHMQLNEYVNLYMEVMKDADGFQVVQSPKAIMIDGKQAIATVYIEPEPNSSDGTSRGKVMSVFIMKDEIVYFLIFHASPSNYALYEPTFVTMFKSFRITE